MFTLSWPTFAVQFSIFKVFWSGHDLFWSNVEQGWIVHGFCSGLILKKIASSPVFCKQRGSALYLVSHRMTISTNIHLLRPVFTIHCIQGYIQVYPVPQYAGSFIFKMVAMLQIPWVFPRVSCLGSAKAVQSSRPGPKIGDESQQIPRYSPVCLRGHPPPGMAANECITFPGFSLLAPVPDGFYRVKTQKQRICRSMLSCFNGEISSQIVCIWYFKGFSQATFSSSTR